jgi:PLP dependent protein
MAVNVEAYYLIARELLSRNVTLVAVSKMKTAADIRQLYDLGHRDFGENYVQELLEKQSQLPADIRWHFIGHLQANKVKYIAPFIHLIHSVDKENLLKEINKQAAKHNRTIDVLLQLYIAKEQTKFGLDEVEFDQLMKNHTNYPNVAIKGIMGMASFSEDEQQLRKEFRLVKQKFDEYSSNGISIVSTGMSNDYKIAVEEGSNMVRIGSLLFGRR